MRKREVVQSSCNQVKYLHIYFVETENENIVSYRSSMYSDY